jgi:glycosyltransferase involved in cell wall biosynthesis
MADSETRPHHRRVRFVYVGWLIKEKGVLDLFEVIKSHSEFSEYEFYFIGGGTLQTTLENEVEKAGFNHVKILGWKSPADVKTILEDMDVLVLPSYSEGFPNVILEAMCARLPIIASDVGSISDAVVDNENGFLFTPGDHERLAQVIKILGEDQALRRKFSEKSWEIVNRNHDLKKNIPQILRVLENFQQGI